MPYTTERMVEFSDTDMAGIMHFAAFFRYMESVEHEFFRSLGLSVYSEYDGQTISFPRVAAKCEFRSPAKCEDVLQAKLTVARLGTSSITYRIGFENAGTPVAEGEVTCVCCKIDHGKPPKSTPLPEQIADLLSPYVEPAA